MLARDVSGTGTVVRVRISEGEPQIGVAYDALLPEQRDVNALGKLDWKLSGAHGEPGRVAVAEVDARIVGLSTYLTGAMTVQRSPVRSLQAIDSVVDSSLRGQGVFSKLAFAMSEAAPELGYDLVWGFPNKAAAPIWFGKLGWEDLGSPPYLVKMLRPGPVLRRLGVNVDPPAVSNRERLTELDCFDSEASMLWANTLGASECAIERNADYLNWRIFACPSARYCTFVADTDRLAAFVSTTTANKHGGRVGYIMEALGGSELGPLIRRAAKALHDDGAELALAWCFPWSANYRAYRSAGFMPLPLALRPVVVRFGARAYSNQAMPALNPRAWYLSYLDSDTV